MKKSSVCLISQGPRSSSEWSVFNGGFRLEVFGRVTATPQTTGQVFMKSGSGDWLVAFKGPKCGETGFNSDRTDERLASLS